MAHAERPSVEELRALLAVAETGTETAAGKRLGITQPVVHRRLAVFRDPPALVRTEANVVELTEAGLKVLPAVRRLLGQYDHLRQFLAGRRRQPNLLTLGVGSSASQHYLARAIARLQQTLPDWEIQARVLRGKERIAAVVDGTLDLAVVSHNQLQIEGIARWACDARGELAIEELAPMPLCVIAQRQTEEGDRLQSVLAAHEVPVAMLAGWRLAGLDRESGIRQQLEGMLAAQKCRPTFVQEAGGWPSVKEFVRQGLCAGLMPLAMLTPEDQGQLVIRRLPATLAMAYRVVHRRDAQAEALPPFKSALADAALEHGHEVTRRWQGVL